jgi:hypothetical protein
MEKRRRYVVRGVARHGTITYNCPTADWALRKLRDFKAADYQDIIAVDPDGVPLTEADLSSVVKGSGAAPSEEAMAAVPQVSRRPALA